jgi:hypothetical protein
VFGSEFDWCLDPDLNPEEVKRVKMKDNEAIYYIYFSGCTKDSGTVKQEKNLSHF